MCVVLARCCRRASVGDIGLSFDLLAGDDSSRAEEGEGAQ